MRVNKEDPAEGGTLLFASIAIFSFGILTHCILVDSSTVSCLTTPFVILGLSGLFCRFLFLMENSVCKHFYSVDPDQMPHYVASDLGLHCLPMTFLQVPGKNGLSANEILRF